MHNFYSYNSYLAHYGIKRKSGRYPWGSGKRPHQHGSKPHKLFAYNNYDGSLTKLGRKKFDKFIEKNVKDPKDLNEEFDSEDKIIKKGQYRYRITDINEPLNERRKYLSDAYDNLNTYQGQMYILPSVMGHYNDAGAIRYKLIKDINVKNYKDVYEYTLNKYGQDKLDAINDVKYLKSKGLDTWSDEFFEKKNEKLRKAYFKAEESTNIQSEFEKNLDDILDHFKDEGYDAITDIVDATYAKSAIILNTPVKYLKQECSTQDLLNVIAKNDKEYNARINKSRT